MNTKDTPWIQCKCGYDQTGLDADTPCPECGQINNHKIRLLAKPGWAWRNCSSPCPKFGFSLAILTLILSLANSLLALYFMLWLLSPGFKGGTAGFALLYPPLLWIFVQLPVALFAICIVFIGATTKGATMLRTYSTLVVMLSIAGSFLIIAFITAFMLA